MIKQKTTNTFQGGMVQDSNPLNAEPTNLRDCLNGTLISNDGDEKILQNDMGNARVFQIRLNSGYVPVGMCVHGGVTYIASYNPITNKSQVGSFPSPQESYFSQSWGEDGDMTTLCGTLGNERLEFVQQLFPTDTVIRPGDQFDIFVSDQKYFDPKLISFTGNSAELQYEKNEDGADIIYKDSFNRKSKKVVGGKILCPKNKAVTLSVCIADSSGNLHDITHTLKRFEIGEKGEGTNTEILFDNDSSLKKNTGTIFQKYPDKGIGENGSIVDQYEVDPKNIYNHKISGNLFLVYKLNTIESVDISAEFLKGPVVEKSQYLDLEHDQSGVSGDIAEGNLDVVFDVTYRYNSPDGYYTDPNDDNLVKRIPEVDITGTYADLRGNISDFNPGKVLNGIQGKQFFDFNNEGETIALGFDADNSILSKPVYNFDTDLYSSRQRYLLEGINIKDKRHIKYSLVPSTIYGNLNFFKQIIEADLEKLNSGEVSIYQWRYFVEDSGININWGLQSYPFIGTRLTNVELKFYNLSNPDPQLEPEFTLPIGERTSYHGNFNNYVSFDNLKSRQVYCVGISYHLTNIINGQEFTGEFYAGFRILITTKLYNKIYAYQNILDFNDLEDQVYEELHSYSPELTHKVNDRIDQSVISVDGSPLLIESTSKVTSEVTKTKSVNVTKEIVSTLSIVEKDLYPFDVRDVTYKYGHLKPLDDSKEIDGDLTIQGSGETGKETVETGIKNLVKKLNSSIQEDGTIKIAGDLESKFVGAVNKERSITFPKALMQYFPKFSTISEETGYVKDQHERLFGYHGYPGLAYPYYIAYGVTYRGLNSHKDHHGVKYVEVDRSDGVAEHNNNTMKDLHSQVYGSDWNYPEVYAVGDNHKQFNMTDFLSNQNFLNLQKDRTFVFFHTENMEYKDSDEYTGSDVGKGVADWIGCYRSGSGENDHKIVNRGTRDILFWKEGNQFYLVTSGVGASTLYYTPQTFCNLMSNIYVKAQDDVTIDNANILSPSNNAYNLDYKVKLKHSIYIAPDYKSYIPNLTAKYDDTTNGVGANFDSLFKKLIDVKLEASELAKLKKYTEFVFNKGKQESSIEFTVGMEGMENIQEIAVMLNEGIFNVPVLIGEDNKMYLEDDQDNPLLLSQSYELATINGKKRPCKFGTRDTNNASIKSNIKIENGKIIPGRLKSTSQRLVTGGSGDQRTTLNLNSQRTIQLK